MKNKLIIIIPCFNEEKKILNVVKNLPSNSDLLVIDDNSDDNSKYILEKNKIPHLKNPKRLGYEGSLLVGIKYAINNNYLYVCTIDGDGEIDSREITKIIKIKDKYDIIYGSRNNMRRFSEKFVSRFYKYFYKLEDPFCGLKLFKLNNKVIFSKFYLFDTFSLRIFHSFYNKNKMIHNIPIKIAYQRKKSRLGNNLIVNLKLMFSFLVCNLKI